ncbi:MULTISPECIES: ATP synthase F1 subunit gamma [Clostridium]|uniref:ATP synthase gamma chain n=1 Tax=Clostridium cibarium TaxID=2762247 RepID=A0ABR8PWZ7_9CLOT|nr:MULTISPECIES: ATP synthase F1 subunit gamma [Clostridium]MBD7912653.1 F0F1 ATP synthase subunit gamma [Clostridium cibarium]
MGAAGLIEIKRRMKSVQSTKKITNAMGLVATSKLRRCRMELSANEEYMKAAEQIVRSLASAESDFVSPYFSGNNSEKKLYIVMTSDQGLCGGYNNNVVTFLENLVENDMNNTRVITVGSKGIGYVKRAGFETVSEYVDIPDIPTAKEVKVICEKALSLYNSKEVSEVHIVYTEFQSSVKQEVKDELLLPVKKLEGTSVDQIVEPDYETVLTDSLEVYLKGKLRRLMLSSKCSEQSSRMTAMDGATSNANDILENLNLKYNRIRQSIITQEITEIVSGAEAQN